MGQQSLIYSFVARGTVILAEYTEFTGNFTGIAAQCLQKLPASNNKFTYTCDGHTFNYLVEDGFSSHNLQIARSVLVLDRGEKIELLVDKTENLRSQAQDFRQQGTKMRRKMWLQNMKIKLIVLGILIALILIIVLSVCHGFNC
ncbi:hypothetical protein J1N35_016849 [Gossypium stocksii]|uniref:Longin domain-containing protein n=1 Tax=Gossypium stocksii TaxID=47602 RepID=A0A9D3VLZ8_9ROSI|nr:hypothetical protein J1N35_016849 [Gossypium stocksii]